jgi:phospholipase C
MPKPKILGIVGAGLLASAAIAAGVQLAGADAPTSPTFATTTPIKHVVVLFQENVSFDHYFGTYPHAVNGAGETPFTPLPGTPSINGLTDNLLQNNPNTANPVRWGPADVVPNIGCDNNHNYANEQKAMDGGLMDRFTENTTGGAPCAGSEALDYFDGNTVQGLWQYAQHFSMSDNSYGTGFGPSTPGAIELISGNTATAVDAAGNALPSQAGNVDNGTIYSNGNPLTAYDGCSAAAANQYALGSNPSSSSAANTSKNVGDLLNSHSITWGWFEGGFTPTSRTPDANYPVLGKPTCNTAHDNVSGASQVDYDAHHNAFAYYKSTSNPEHLPPSSPAMVGKSEAGVGHQYDVSDFDTALAAGNLPAVSFLKAPHYEDGHAGYSDPLDEQRYLAQKINAIEASPDWASTAIIVAYDDSDGWYDHQAPPIVRSSTSAEDFYNGTGQCGTTHTGTQVTQANDRCGMGPRLPLLVISPYAKRNFVDHTATDQTSILRFIEDNWSLGRIGGGSLDVKANPITNMFDFNPDDTRSPALKLDPDTGAPVGDNPVPAGPQGPAGTNGANGVNGSNGATGATGLAGAQGLTGPAGPKGSTGAKGTKGSTGSVGTIKCTGHLLGHKVVVSCRASHSTKTRTALRVRLLRGTHQLATASTMLHGATAKVTLAPKQAVRRGTYSLRLSIAQPNVPVVGQKHLLTF